MQEIDHQNFMSDLEKDLSREVQELKAEVTRLRHRLELVLVAVGLVLLAILPNDVLQVVVLTAVGILFALLISPVRHSIFPTIFKKRASKKSAAQPSLQESNP